MFSLRKIRPLMALLGVVMLLMTTLPAYAQQTSPSASTAMDMIILIDDSSSMYQTKAKPLGNDPDKLRREAAAILLNMCETTASRAAVFSFGGTSVRPVVPEGFSYDQGLLSISGKEGLKFRQSLTNEITTYGDWISSDTRVDYALRKAAATFDATRTISTNQRVILIVSDGKPSSPHSKGDTTEQGYQNGLSDALAAVAENPMFDPAQPNSAKVYVVEINNEDFATNSNDPYVQIVTPTGGKVYNANSVQELPGRFAEMLADQIGSTLTNDKVVAIDNGDGTYTLPVRIPNQSVTEANILMSSAGILPDSVELYRPTSDGSSQLAYVDNQTVFFNKTKSFVQFKILNTASNGTWRLTYRKDPAAEVEPAASVTVLFSYNLEIQADAQVSGKQRTLSTMEKTDGLDINAWFVDSQGVASTDTYLYQPVTQDELGNSQGIQTVVYALPAAAEASDTIPASAVVMAPLAKGNNGFELRVKLSELGIVTSGDYKLYIHAEGDGLKRDLVEPIPFTVVNQPPQFVGSTSLPFLINDPADTDPDHGMVKALSLQDGDLFVDSDIGIDTMTLTAQSSDRATLLVVDEDNGSNDQIELRANKVGTATLTLIADDGDAGGRVSQDITVSVMDVTQLLTDRYQPEIVILSPEAEDGHYPIDAEIQLAVRILDTQANNYVSINDYELTPTLTLSELSGKMETLSLAPGDNANEWVASFESGYTSRQVTLNAEVAMGDPGNHFVLRPQQPLTLNIGNVAPVVNEDAVNQYRYDYSIEALSFLGQVADRSYILPMPEFFIDDDPASALAYTASIYPLTADLPEDADTLLLLPQADAASISLTSADNGELTVVPVKAGDFRLLVGVKDSDQQAAYFTRDIHVVSLQAIFWHAVMVYGAIALAALILILLLIHALKPSYEGLSFDMLTNGNTQRVRKIQRSKKKLSMSGFQPDATGKEAVPMIRALSGLTIQPGKHHSIIMKLNKPASTGVIVEVNGRPLRVKHKQRLNTSNMLVIRGQQNGAEVAYGWRLRYDGATPRPKTAKGGKPRSGNSGPATGHPQDMSAKSGAAANKRPN